MMLSTWLSLGQARPSKGPLKASNVVGSLVDIIENLLAHLDPSEVGNCLTVNKLWMPIARKRIYANVCVETKAGLERCHALLANIEQRTWVANHLRGICISRSSAVLFSELAHLAPQLRSLTIASGAGITSSAFASVLPSLPNLTSLTLINVDFRAAGNIPSTLQGTPHALLALVAARAAHNPSLTVLRVINSADLTSEGLRAYLELAGADLIELEVAGCPGINEMTLLDVAEFCDNLERLTVKGALMTSHTSENDADAARIAMAALAKCQALRSLTLRKLPENATVHGDAHVLAPLAALGQLQSIELSNLPWLTPDDLGYIACNVANVRLSGLSALRSLPLLPAVRSLSWSGSSVSHFALAGLYHLCHTSPALQRIVLDRTEVAPHSSSRLRAISDASPDIPLPGYKQYGIFDENLPSELVADALSRARQLESVALFGAGRRLDWIDRQVIQRACPNVVRIA